FERGRDRFALLDTFVNGADGVADDDVARRFFYDGQSLQNRDAAADQRPESPRKSGNGHLADNGSDDRHLEFEFVEKTPSELCPDKDEKEYHEHSDDPTRDCDVILDSTTDSQDEPGERGQLSAFHHSRK